MHRTLLATAALTMTLLAGPAAATSDEAVQQVVARHVKEIVPADGNGGVAVAVLIEGRTLFFNEGFADRASRRPITSDSLVNLASLRKVFEAILLAQGVREGKVALDDPAAKYIPELARGGDFRRVTLGQLATHTSGLLLPQDHPPWPDWGYTRAEFIAALNAWKADKEHEPGRQHLYTHAGYVVLQLALERALGAPIDELIGERILRPLGMSSTVLPHGGGNSIGELSPDVRRRAVQGYDPDGKAHGTPGEQESFYQFPGAGKIYSSVRDMSVLIAAHLGDVPVDQSLREAMELAVQGIFAITPRNQQALAWEVNDEDGPRIVEKHGGLWNGSGHIAMMPVQKLGIVILTNRGNQPVQEVSRAIMRDLARP